MSLFVDILRFFGFDKPAPVPVPPPAAHRLVGMNCDPRSAVDIAALKTLGVTDARITLTWSECPVPSQMTTANSAWMQFRAGAQAAGLSTLNIVHSPPSTVQTQADLLAQWPPYMAELVTLYPGQVWEIGNEWDAGANIGPVFNGIAPVSVAIGKAFAPIMQAVYRAMKAADPTCTVVLGGLVSSNTPGQVLTGLQSFAPLKTMCDILAVHAYPGVFPPTGPQPMLPAQFAATYRAVKNAGVSIWCTEFGSNASTATQQQSDIAACLTAYDAETVDYDHAYSYVLVEDGTGFGLTSVTGSPRPAFSLFIGR